MIHVQRYLAALLVLLAACGTYALAVAPWVTPQPVVRRRPAGNPPPPLEYSHEQREELARLFPTGHWARQEPKVVKTEQCTLLIQDYERLPDGRLVLTPCILIFRSSPAAAAEAPAAKGAGRTIVLETPKAELMFDRPLDLVKAELGRVQNGRLPGEVTIFAPATLPDGRDELHLRTRAVQIDRERIATLDEVEFRFGNNSGRGRDLAIELLQPDQTQPRAAQPRFSGIRQVTLRTLDYLRVATSGASLLGNAVPSASAGSAADATLEITCQDGVVFDVGSQLARFQEQVVVRRRAASSAPDQLRCEQLLLAFGDPPQAAGLVPQADDPLAGRLQRIVALGSPVVLEAPASGVRATAATVEYSLADKALALKASEQQGAEQVSLVRNGQHLVARDLHYQIPEQGQLGPLQAAGPGELRLLPGSGPSQQPITARWLTDLQIRRQDDYQVISLTGEAAVQGEPLGKLAANVLHLWVFEAPQAAPQIAPQIAANGGDHPQPSQASPAKRPALLPHRLLGEGNVRLTSQQLDAETSRLEAWFRHVPPESPPAQTPPPQGPIREPPAIQPAAFSPTTPEVAPRPPNLKKFHASSGLIQMQLVVSGRRFDLEDLNLRGHAAIDEVHTPQPSQQPIRLRGDLLELRQGTRPTAMLQLVGQPAEVGGRGMSLAGNKIEVLRGQNVAKIDGPGEATLPVGEGSGFGGEGSGFRGQGSEGRVQGSEGSVHGSEGRVQGSGFGVQGTGGTAGLASGVPTASGPAAPQTLHIVWQQGLVFDGLAARISGDVSLRTATQTAQTPSLVATLNRRIDFQSTSGQPQVELARVLLDGGQTGVSVESRSYDELGEPTSREQLHARNVSIDRLAGTLHADGPGWVSTVRKGGNGLPGLPGQAQQQSLLPPAGNQGLTSVHVAFEREIEGRLADRRIEFRQQVFTTYSPATTFGDVIAADPLAPLAERVFLMQSDVLRMTEFLQPAARWFELAAAGRTQVRGNKFQIEAPLVTYNSDKEVITLQAEGRAKARIFAEPAPGSPPGWMEGDRFRYNLRTGELITDALSNVRIPLGDGIKIPLPSLPGPPSQPNRRR